MTITLAGILILIGICVVGFCEIEKMLKKILNAIEEK